MTTKKCNTLEVEARFRAALVFSSSSSFSKFPISSFEEGVVVGAVVPATVVVLEACFVVLVFGMKTLVRVAVIFVAVSSCPRSSSL